MGKQNSKLRKGKETLSTGNSNRIKPSQLSRQPQRVPSVSLLMWNLSRMKNMQKRSQMSGWRKTLAGNGLANGEPRYKRKCRLLKLSQSNESELKKELIRYR